MAGTNIQESATYDGFISYSHAAAADVVRELHEQLETFAKPLFKGRRLRVYRDETSEGATADIDAILDRVEESRALIFIASPQSGREQNADGTSAWPRREAERYLEARKRTLEARGVASTELERKLTECVYFVLIDGSLPWVPDSVGDPACPNSLKSAVRTTPLVLDARALATLSPKELRDSDAFKMLVAKIAAPMLGLRLDEAFGQHIRAQRRVRNALLAVMSGLGLLLVGLLWQSYRNVVLGKTNDDLSREIKAQIVSLEDAKKATIEQQRFARSEAASGFVSAGEAALETNPALAIRLATAAHLLDDARDTSKLLRRAALRAPVWANARVGAGGGKSFAAALKSWRSAQFLMDASMEHLLGQSPNSPTDYFITDLKTGRASRLDKELGSLIELYPRSRTIAAFNTRDGIALHTFAHGELSAAIASVSGGRKVACAAGNVPCLVATAAGIFVVEGKGSQYEVRRLAQTFDNPIEGLLVHASGRSACAVTTQGVWWFELETSDPKARRLQIAVTRQKGADTFMRDAPPHLAWGPHPEHVLATEVSQTGFNYHVELLALDALRGTRRSIAKTDYQATGVGTFVFRATQSGSRVAWTETQPGRDLLIRVMNIDWMSGGPVLQKEEEGILRGTIEAQTSAHVLDAEFSPNGNYLAVVTVILGKAGTQAPRGIAESWAITALDEESSDAPEALRLPLGDELPVEVAYASDAKRLAVVDAQGLVNVFNVRASVPPEMTIGVRVPEAVEARMRAITTVTPIGTNAAYLSVEYTNADHRIVDLASGQERSLEAFTGGSAVLALGVTGTKASVVTTDAIIEVELQTGNVLKKTKTEAPVTDAIMSDGIISARAAEGIYLYSREPTQLIGLLKAGVEDWLDRERRGAVVRRFEESYLLGDAGVASVGGLRVDHSSWSLERWTGDRGGKPLELVKVWAYELPNRTQANRWVSVCPLVERDLVLVLVGDYSGHVSLIQLSLSGGQTVPGLALPGAIDVSKLLGIGDVLTLGDGTTVALFRSGLDASAHWVRWSKDQAMPSSTKAITNFDLSDYFGPVKLSDGRYVFVLEDRYVAAESGAEAPFELGAVFEPQGVKKVRPEALIPIQSGQLDPDDLTRLPLPAEYQERVKSLIR